MNEKEPLLKLVDVKKYFPILRGFFRKQVGAVKAVDGVSLEIMPGEVHALVGESGSGKSTLGRLAIKLIDVTDGKIFFRGKEIEKFSSDEMIPYRKFIQMIFQDPFSSLNPRHTIETSIGDGLIYHGLAKNEREKRDQVAFILKEVGLAEDAMFRYPHQFSGGQQQRVCIGRALALKPELIICDEAVSALDVSIQAQILNLLSRLQQEFNLSYLFISHDLSIVQHISDRITVMYLGKVMETGKTEDIFRTPKHPYTQSLLASIPKKNPNDEKPTFYLKGEIPSAANPPPGCPFHTRCPYAKPICKEPPPKKTIGKDHTYFCILD